MNFKEIIKKGIWMDLPDAQLLYKTAKEIKPKIVLEIGAGIGASSMILGHIVKETNGHLYTIELNPLAKWNENMKYYGLENNSTIIKGESPNVDKSIIPTPVDYLLIDGNHETKNCIADYFHWKSLVREGGRIAFHDYYAYDLGLRKKLQDAVNYILSIEKSNLIKVEEVESKWGMIVFQKNYKEIK